MYTKGTELRQEKLEQCLLTTLHLKPYWQISVSDLCLQTGISRKSFYRYFGNKDGCLNALLDRIMLESLHYEYHCEEDTTGCPVELLQALAYWKSHHYFLEALVKNELTVKLVERTIHHLVTEEWNFVHTLRLRNPDVEGVLVFAVSGYIALLLDWHRSGYQKSVAQMGHIIMQIATTPLVQYP